jgi:hypothetical protein
VTFCNLSRWFRSSFPAPTCPGLVPEFFSRAAQFFLREQSADIGRDAMRSDPRRPHYTPDRSAVRSRTRDGKLGGEISPPLCPLTILLDPWQTTDHETHAIQKRTPRPASWISIHPGPRPTRSVCEHQRQTKVLRLARSSHRGGHVRRNHLDRQSPVHRGPYHGGTAMMMTAHPRHTLPQQDDRARRTPSTTEGRRK